MKLSHILIYLDDKRRVRIFADEKYSLETYSLTNKQWVTTNKATWTDEIPAYEDAVKVINLVADKVSQTSR